MRQRQFISHPSTDRLVEEHLGFARVLVRRLSNTLPTHCDTEALESDAFFGLLLAARSFDPARGVAFTTYAAKRIWGAMIDGLRDRQGCSRGHTPPVIRSLSNPMFDADGREVTLGDLIDNGEEEVGAEIERREQVDHLLKRLRSPERRMVREFYFENLTQDRIGERHGISASRVSQRIKAARERMREVACAN